MKVIIQRVTKASVMTHDKCIAKISDGLLILLGIIEDDSKEDIDWLVNKIINMRIFSDDNGKMNESLLTVNGEVLIISQFTLYASTKKGNRPSFIKAAKPDIAIPLYHQFLNTFEARLGKTVAKGEFGADMKVSLINDGPVTIVVDSKNRE